MRPDGTVVPPRWRSATHSTAFRPLFSSGRWPGAARHRCALGESMRVPPHAPRRIISRHFCLETCVDGVWDLLALLGLWTDPRHAARCECARSVVAAAAPRLVHLSLQRFLGMTQRIAHRIAAPATQPEQFGHPLRAPAHGPPAPRCPRRASPAPRPPLRQKPRRRRRCAGLTVAAGWRRSAWVMRQSQVMASAGASQWAGAGHWAGVRHAAGVGHESRRGRASWGLLRP